MGAPPRTCDCTTIAAYVSQVLFPGSRFPQQRGWHDTFPSIVSAPRIQKKYIFPQKEVELLLDAENSRTIYIYIHTYIYTHIHIHTRFGIPDKNQTQLSFIFLLLLSRWQNWAILLKSTHRWRDRFYFWDNASNFGISIYCILIGILGFIPPQKNRLYMYTSFKD